ncbi:phosphoenolpyruvate carboxykinase (ATP) [Candidatus Micrarchaeota archaeon]|nr:phosphoenolpyruvate carboxykinase (ATP) [Candidatus Micrarchaeota archaeon]MBU1166372.1 phosphoenolpyruvate carboxykinase (ATP) [Candidatus Micrarchaeota archaeon]MBU1886896.1 phosphoenolpyruvate carboxykinase (ATP) [Candidatus Micrarchaeota archaeon]
MFRKAIDEMERNVKIIDNPSFEALRKLCETEGVTTTYGSMAFRTKVKGRSAKLTEIIEGTCSKEHDRLLNKVVEYLKGKKLIKIDRRMCNKKPFHCRAYISASYPHIAYMWTRMLFDIKKKNTKPDFISVQIPEWPKTKIIADAQSGVTFILGSDYTGEMKKANLRMAMYRTKQRGGLGLHAGSKLIKVRDHKTKKIIEKGALLFGLSATGKTTLTCHHHWLDKRKGEGVAIRQDDVVLMQKDSSCLGTEDNFYIKTEGLEPENQPLLYKAAISKHALFENVTVLPDGHIDFFDETITSNGRGVVLRKEIEYTDDSVDLKRADMILFITRRKTIVPPVAKLTNEQAAAFFMLGESIGSSASDADPGKPVREVGTNPFIIGSKDEEGNRFYELLKKNKHVDCYILNTGRMGMNRNDPGEKITVHDSAVIIKEIARETVKWKKDPDWGYYVLDHCPGIDVSKFHPEKHYSKKEYQKLTKELRKERKEWLAQFKKLRKEIKNTV